VIGKVGRVTGRVGPGLVGEIMVSVRGGSEAFYAHPQRPDEVIGALGNVDHMVVLNGADGMADLLTKALAMGGTGLGLARQLLASMGEKQGGPANNGLPPADTARHTGTLTRAAHAARSGSRDPSTGRVSRHEVRRRTRCA
jgi:hypothetical protein